MTVPFQLERGAREVPSLAADERRAREVPSLVADERGAREVPSLNPLVEPIRLLISYYICAG